MWLIVNRPFLEQPFYIGIFEIRIVYINVTMHVDELSFRTWWTSKYVIIAQMFHLSCVAINIKDHVPCNFLLVTKLWDSTVRNLIKLKQSFVLFYSFETIKIQAVECVQNGL